MLTSRRLEEAAFPPPRASHSDRHPRGSLARCAANLGPLLRLAVALKLDLGELKPAIPASAEAMPELRRRGV